MKTHAIIGLIICFLTVILSFSEADAKTDEKKNTIKIKTAVAKKSQNQTKISQILISGLQKISPSVVLLSLSIKPGTAINEKIIDENLKRIYSIGYFNENITADTLDTPAGIKVTFKVNENPIVQKIVIKGNSLFDEKKILNSMQTRVGNVFNHCIIPSDVRSIQNLFDNAGYLMNRVENVQFDAKTLYIYIEENKIGKVKVVGNIRTRDRIIMRELRFSEGEMYDAKKVERSLQKIFALGYFSEIRPRCEAGSKPGIIDFIIEVVESKTGMYTIGGSHSSANGLSGIFQVSEKNHRGKGQTVNIMTEFGGRRAYELGFIEPKVNGKNYSLGMNIYNSKQTQKLYRTNLEALEYGEDRRGFSLSCSKNFSDSLIGSLTFKDEFIKLNDTEKIKTSIDRLYIREGGYQTLSALLSKDTRNNYAEPTKGSFNSINLDSTGGFLKGPDSFIKYGLTLRKYHAVNKRDVLAGRFSAGAISLSSGTLPIYEEYGLGGVYTLRGYEFREFAGDKMAYANIEYRHKFNKSFNGHLFYDMGDAWGGSGTQSATMRDGKFDLKKGYGAGILMITPIAPIRFDYAIGRSNSGKFFFSMDRMF